MFAYVARGLENVHEKGLIHRDLKPSNCFMDNSEEVKIGDFGFSRESCTGGRKDSTTSLDDDVLLEHKDSEDFEEQVDEEITTKVGTSSYASPEQMNGSYYDSSTDAFSLGIILFELCYPMYMVRVEGWFDTYMLLAYFSLCFSQYYSHPRPSSEIEMN